MRFHIVKRDAFPLWKRLAFYLGAVVIALLIGAALLSSMDVDPLTFYQKMVTMGIPGNKFPWRIVENFVKLFVPLLITSLALSLAFRMRFWNIGGEGQFIMGAICASAAAHKLGPVLPQPLKAVRCRVPGVVRSVPAAVHQGQEAAGAHQNTLPLTHVQGGHRPGPFPEAQIAQHHGQAQGGHPGADGGDPPPLSPL